MTLGFRPLLGFFIFQSYIEENDTNIVQSFPSPIGVLYISMIQPITQHNYLMQFPSPIGVLYISILERRCHSLKNE